MLGATPNILAVCLTRRYSSSFVFITRLPKRAENFLAYLMPATLPILPRVFKHPGST